MARNPEKSSKYLVMGCDSLGSHMGHRGHVDYSIYSEMIVIFDQRKSHTN